MLEKWLICINLFVLLSLPLTRAISTQRRNYEVRQYTNANLPQWKQRACQKSPKEKMNLHYICDENGDVKCLPGWQGDLCQVPMCRRGCDPMNGYCQRPDECRCRIGYSGEHCERCIPLPGCQHGFCNKPFECICKPGWDGLFCTEPTCRSGCHSTRGYCEAPGECRCRIGWAGRNCSDCAVLPGCQHGTCEKPLECKCLPGYTGLLCQTAICAAGCHKQRGYCQKPGECRCKVGWTGPNCDQCFAYPGCVHGDCERPWECNCKPGWGGMLCNEKLTYCEDNPGICENSGQCISFTKDDGSYRCECKQGYLGKNCEIRDEFMLTSTAEPKITPPPRPGFSWGDQNESTTVTTPMTWPTAAMADNKTIKATLSTATAALMTTTEATTTTLTSNVLNGNKFGKPKNDTSSRNDDLTLSKRVPLPLVFPTMATNASNNNSTIPTTLHKNLISSKQEVKLQQKQQLKKPVNPNATSATPTPGAATIKTTTKGTTPAAIVGTGSSVVTVDDEEDNEDVDDEDEEDEDDEEEDDDEEYEDDEEDSQNQLLPDVLSNVA